MKDSSAFLRFLIKPQMITLEVVILIVLWGHLIPLEGSRFFYTISILIKDLLSLFLPFAVCVYIAHTLSSFRLNAFALVGTLILFEAASNAMAVHYGWGVAYFLRDNLHVASSLDQTPLSSLDPYVSIDFLKPNFWMPSVGTYAGLFLGLFLAVSPLAAIQNTLAHCKSFTDIVFQKIFARLIPLFIVGYLLNLQHSGHLSQLGEQYGMALLWIILAMMAYLIFLYATSSGFRITPFIHQLKNTLPTGLMAFTSASSAATMPYTIEAARKNVRNPDFASMVIPATTNIQQIGDCIANAFFALVLILSAGMALPSLEVWIPFVVIYVLARFTTAAVLGGAIFILLPIFEGYLGFTPEMLALLLAFNIIMDPIITASNVMANGALCILFEKVWDKISIHFCGDKKSCTLEEHI